MITLRKSHLRKTYLGGLSEVGLPESISHQKVPLIYYVYMYFYSLIWALGVMGHVYQGPNGDFVAEIDEITKVKIPENTSKTIKYICHVERSCLDVS